MAECETGGRDREAGAACGRVVAEATARREQPDSLAALLDDLDRELGEPSAVDYAWADVALGLA